MSRSTKLALVFVLVLALGLGGSVTYAAVSVARAGMIDIEVSEKAEGGEGVSLMVPGIAVSLAAIVLPFAMPEEAAREIRPHVPLLRAVADGLSECPDAVFVTVESPHENVRIAKRNGHLEIDVVNDTEEVHLRLPIHAVRVVANALERISRV